MSRYTQKKSKKTMTLRRFLRLSHYWISLVILIPTGIILFAGTLLILKKQIPWVQPPSVSGVAKNQIPALSYEDLLEALRTQPQAGISDWSDIKKIDIRPSKGMAKVLSKTGWEVQIDTENSNVLNVSYRRSDTIEAIHDGSYFADWVKLYIFFPTGILLIIMWGTGIYLFFLPQLRKKKKKKRRI